MKTYEIVDFNKGTTIQPLSINVFYCEPNLGACGDVGCINWCPSPDIVCGCLNTECPVDAGCGGSDNSCGANVIRR